MSITKNEDVYLEKCPFCGGKAELTFSGIGNKPYVDYDGEIINTPFTYTAFCVSCGCRIANYRDPNMAVDAWNRRVDND